MTDLKKLLNPDDLDTINARAETEWVPKEPRQVLLPYKSETTPKEVQNIERRKEKAKEVMDGYNKVVDDCNRLEAEIEERCKDVKVTINESQNMSVMAAMRRVFGPDVGNTITFEHYKRCIQELARINNQLPEI